MAAPQKDAREHIERMVSGLSPAEIEKRLSSKFHPGLPRVPGATKTSPDVVDKRWALLPHAADRRQSVADPKTLDEHLLYERNIENFIGTAKVPIGLAG